MIDKKNKSNPWFKIQGEEEEKPKKDIQALAVSDVSHGSWGIKPLTIMFLHFSYQLWGERVGWVKK